MKGTDYKTKEDVLRRAQEAVGIPMKDIDLTGRLRTGKGAIGTVLEESWFGYSVNSESEPDFPEAEVELKATPYIRTANGIRAKERLVCNIINYMTEYKKTFYSSSFWHKCKTILIMSYEHRNDVPKSEFTVDQAVLFSFPEEDLAIIKQDWEKIISKIRNGEAHLLTEGDTLYLAACTKGSTAEKSYRQQPFSSALAKQRAYSLKPSYMTKILNAYIYGSKQDEHIIKDWHELESKSFEELILEKLSIYYGETQKELKSKFNVKTNAKNLNSILLAKMLGVTGRIADTEEFQSANIVPKTIRIQVNGHIKENMPFPPFKFTEIIKEDWESSEFRNYLEPTKFLFVIFRENFSGEYVFERAMFWNIPAEDLDEVRRVWERTVQIIKDGVQLRYVGGICKNNLPKLSESPIAHVRPHAQSVQDVYPLPDGRKMTKQSFWLNASYIERIISGSAANKLHRYQSVQKHQNVAEEIIIDSPNNQPLISRNSRIYNKQLGTGTVVEVIVNFKRRKMERFQYPFTDKSSLMYISGTRIFYSIRGHKGVVVGYTIQFNDTLKMVSLDSFKTGQFIILNDKE